MDLNHKNRESLDRGGHVGIEKGGYVGNVEVVLRCWL